MNGKKVDGMEPREPSNDTTTDDFLTGGNADDTDDAPDAAGADEGGDVEESDAAADQEGDGSTDTAPDNDTEVTADQPGIVELEDGTLRRRMTVYLNPEDGKKVKVLAALQNRKISDVLAEAVEEYLDGREMPDL